MRSSSIEVVLLMFGMYISLKFHVSVLSRVGGWGGWVESIIRLISTEAEAEALLGLAELGNICLCQHQCAGLFPFAFQ